MRRRQKLSTSRKPHLAILKVKPQRQVSRLVKKIAPIAAKAMKS